MSMIRRIADSARNRQWGTFGVEIALIVIGVLVALWIDGAVQAREEQRTEANYLRLLERDLSLTVDQLEVVTESADATVSAGLAAYEEMSRTGPRDVDRVIAGVIALTGRLTVRPFEAAFTDLLSTGNLRLIRDSALRDAIVSFYETTRLNYETFARNRTFFNDELYGAFVIGEGLVTPYVGEHPVPAIREMVDELESELGGGFEHAGGRLADLPADAPEWDGLRTRTWAMILTTRFLAEAAANMRREAEELRTLVLEALGNQSRLREH